MAVDSMPQKTHTSNLSAARLRAVLSYHPETGEFEWRRRRGGGCRVGRFTGTPDASGYLMIRVDYVIYKAHRLAWLYMTGDWPEKILDHADGDKRNNRWSNLRSADHVKNAANSRRRAGYAHKYRGVKFNKKCPARPFSACVGFDNRRIYLGSFKTAEAAYAAYCKEAVRLRGEFARLD